MEYTKEEKHTMHKLANKIIIKFRENDGSGRLLYLFVNQLSVLSKLAAFRGDDEYRFVIVKEDEYKKLKSNESMENNLAWIEDMTNSIQ